MPGSGCNKSLSKALLQLRKAGRLLKVPPVASTQANKTSEVAPGSDVLDSLQHLWNQSCSFPVILSQLQKGKPGSGWGGTGHTLGHLPRLQALPICLGIFWQQEHPFNHRGREWHGKIPQHLLGESGRLIRDQQFHGAQLWEKPEFQREKKALPGL